MEFYGCRYKIEFDFTIFKLKSIKPALLTL